MPCCTLRALSVKLRVASSHLAACHRGLQSNATRNAVPPTATVERDTERAQQDTHIIIISHDTLPGWFRGSGSSAALSLRVSVALPSWWQYGCRISGNHIFINRVHSEEGQGGSVGGKAIFLSASACRLSEEPLANFLFHVIS